MNASFEHMISLEIIVYNNSAIWKEITRLVSVWFGRLAVYLSKNCFPHKCLPEIQTNAGFFEFADINKLLTHKTDTTKLKVVNRWNTTQIIDEIRKESTFIHLQVLSMDHVRPSSQVYAKDSSMKH